MEIYSGGALTPPVMSSKKIQSINLSSQVKVFRADMDRAFVEACSTRHRRHQDLLHYGPGWLTKYIFFITTGKE
jgi:hypothetical protein